MLSLNQFIVKEHIGMFKLSDTYDILDAQNGAKVGLAKEQVPGYVHALRILINKQL